MEPNEPRITFDKPFKAATHPPSDKVQDTLMSKLVWTNEDCDLLSLCLRNYEA